MRNGCTLYARFMYNIRVSRLSANFVEDAVKPFLKENDRSLSCLSDVNDTDKNAKSEEDTVIIAVGNQENENQEENRKVLQFFDFKNEKWIPLIHFYGLDCCNILAIENSQSNACLLIKRSALRLYPRIFADKIFWTDKKC